MTERSPLSHHRLALWNFGLLLGIYSACRVVFLAAHWRLYQESPAGAILRSLLKGGRFDLSVLALINAPFVLLLALHAAGLRRYISRWLLRIWFLLSNAFFIGLNVADVDYFRITGNRITGDLVFMRKDVGRELGALLLLHWPLTLTAIALVLLLGRFYRGPTERIDMMGRKKSVLPVIALIPLLVLAQRGGVQLKPLHPGHAFPQRTPELAILTLNAPFTFLHSLRREALERKSYFPDEVSALAALDRKPPAIPEMPALAQNIVIIIVESLASEYMGHGNDYPGFTPFLDSLASAGPSFPRHLANGRRSMEALSAILAGIPSLQNDAFITSRYQTNRISGIGSLLAERGYQTLFFHGGKNGTMSFDALVGHAGFAHYFGLDEYPNKSDFDGHWGIFDGPYLQYVARRLDSVPQPFLAGVFTLSSHEPYALPPDYKSPFPAGDLPIHASIGYVDFALREFFDTASKMEWYEQTLFIITGDHTQQTNRPAYLHVLGNHAVPLILAHPARRLEAPNGGRVAQHADIPPTILDYLGLPGVERYLYSSSLLSQGPGFALLLDHGQYRLVLDALVVRMDQDEGLEYFAFGHDPREIAPLEPRERFRAEGLKLKAYVQLFNNRMIDNTLAGARPAP